jgi:hypothetical protein
MSGLKILKSFLWSYRALDEEADGMTSCSELMWWIEGEAQRLEIDISVSGATTLDKPRQTVDEPRWKTQETV